MPLLRFDILEGRTDDEIGKLLDAAHAAQMEAFGVPVSDRFQVVNEHKTQSRQIWGHRAGN
jgi:hypothetical protein